jgi:hypothetical protein
MNFQDTIYELAKQTEEIEVCAGGAWCNAEKDIGIRSGWAPANVEFHDPDIDGTAFMICGDIFEKSTYHRETLISYVDGFGPDNYIVRLRAIGGYPPYIANIQLGDYRIESIERVMWHEHYTTEKVLKLKLKRLNSGYQELA